MTKPDELAAEVDKLAVWAAGEPIQARDVLDLVAGRAETSIFSLTDSRDVAALATALGASEELLARSDRSRRDEAPYALQDCWRITSHGCGAVSRSRRRSQTARGRLQLEDAPVRDPKGVRPGGQLLGRRGSGERRSPSRRSTMRSRAAAGCPATSSQRTLVAITRPEARGETR